MSTSKSNFWSSPLTKSRITSDGVKMPEMLLGYFIGPFGALLSSGIFTSILQNYFTDVLKLDLGFLTTLQLVSTVLIVASNLIVGQLIEHTKALAGKARPWILLSALTLSVASVLMFIVPFEGMAKMVWIAIAYNLYYAVAYPIYNTANSTMIPVSTRDSKQRGALGFQRPVQKHHVVVMQNFGFHRPSASFISWGLVVIMRYSSVFFGK